MRIFAAWFVASFLLLSVSASARPIPILRGKVVDSAGHPLAGAAIRVLGTSPARGAYTKADGSYMIVGLRRAEYDIGITLAGYRAIMRTGVRILVDTITTLDVTLAVDTTTHEITIPSRGVVRPGQVSPITREEIGRPARTRISIPDQIAREVATTARQGMVIGGLASTEDAAARHTLPSPNVYPRIDPAVYMIRSGRNQPSIRFGRWDRDGRGGTSVSLPWRWEQPVIDVPVLAGEGSTADAKLVVVAPTMGYRPMISWPGDFVRMDGHLEISVDDPFTGGFGGGYYPSIPACQTLSPGWFYDPAKRDVVEPSLEERADWIRGYEERRDMLSPGERQLESWRRRR